MKIEVGDAVEYFECKDDKFGTVYNVIDVLPEGVPSHPFPLLKLKGKAGYVSEDHCVKVNGAWLKAGEKMKPVTIAPKYKIGQLIEIKREHCGGIMEPFYDRIVSISADVSWECKKDHPKVVVYCKTTNLSSAVYESDIIRAIED